MKPDGILEIGVDNNSSRLSQASYDLGTLQMLLLMHIATYEKVLFSFYK